MVEIYFGGHYFDLKIRSMTKNLVKYVLLTEMYSLAETVIWGVNNYLPLYDKIHKIN